MEDFTRFSPWFLTVFACLFTYVTKEKNGNDFNIFKYPDPIFNDTYDFIVIGAGSAGSVVANRLSEVKAWTILLIEAGGEEDIISDTPILAPLLWNTDKDWNYSTVEQKYACRENSGICKYPRGHVLGGGSTLNFMNYVRGNKYDYDRWADLDNEGWRYNDVLPYFLKSEDIRIEELSDSKYHSKGGYLTVDYSRFYSPLQKDFIDAGLEIGYKIRDFNGEIQTGIGYPQYTIRSGSRCSTAKAFLSCIKERPNLHIAKRTVALKINLNKLNNRAESVTIMRNSQEFVIKVEKDVVLSAGAINSPKLLMLSGIGPKEHLSEINIPTKIDLPVGMHFSDHSYIITSFQINKTITITKRKIENIETIMQYANGKIGPLASALGMEAVGFFTLDKSDNPVPDVQIYMISFATSKSDVPLILISLSKLRPESTGSVRLKSSDPADAPLIDPRYHEHPKDFDDTLRGCMLILEIISSQALSKYNPQIYANGTSCEGLNGEEYCKCAVSFLSGTMFHPVSTARMSKDGVVSHNLSVWGINNLRVVDASIMPFITSGNTNAPVIMIAEKASDIIKQFWKI